MGADTIWNHSCSHSQKRQKDAVTQERCTSELWEVPWVVWRWLLSFSILWPTSALWSVCCMSLVPAHRGWQGEGAPCARGTNPSTGLFCVVYQQGGCLSLGISQGHLCAWLLGVIPRAGSAGRQPQGRVPGGSVAALWAGSGNLPWVEGTSISSQHMAHKAVVQLQWMLHTASFNKGISCAQNAEGQQVRAVFVVFVAVPKPPNLRASWFIFESSFLGLIPSLSSSCLSCSLHHFGFHVPCLQPLLLKENEVGALLHKEPWWKNTVLK